MQHFQGTAADVAGGQANAGRGKVELHSSERSQSPLVHTLCRDAQANAFGEQQLLQYLLNTISSAGYTFPRALIINYYVALKTNPFVILAGAAGQGKKDLARLFAEALVGSAHSQYLLISRTGTWAEGTGKDSYYRSLQEQFSSWRFLELLQEAAAPSNLGKAYFVCFDALYPEDLEFYFEMLQVEPSGVKRLNLPGFPLENQPIIPPNVYITAVLDTDDAGALLGRNVLRHAGLIEFRSEQPLTHRLHVINNLRSLPPAGYQRLWLRAAIDNVRAARARLGAVLGFEQVARLHYSSELALLFWRSGQVLMKEALDELTRYIANSFDSDGRGLFDPTSSLRNAEIAYDAQVIQRTLWRLYASGDDELRNDLKKYLARLARIDIQVGTDVRYEVPSSFDAAGISARITFQQAVA